MNVLKATRPADALTSNEPCEVGFLGRKTSIDAIKTTADNQSSESANDYLYVVAVLNDRWRVIECRNRIQWILQRRAGQRHGTARWDGRSYCRTKEALDRVCRAAAGEIEPAAKAVLALLPDWIEPDNARALRWIAGHCNVSLATARTIAEHAGIGGRWGK